MLTITKQQQEQDPTNLYIANLPLTYKETDVENLLSKYGQVISTRILRDQNAQSKGEYRCCCPLNVMVFPQGGVIQHSLNLNEH